MSRLKLLVSILVCCSAMISNAQDKTAERYLEVRGTSELDMKPLARATANLSEGGNNIQTVQTGADGSFSFRLEMNKQYTIEVIKDGLVAKRISFNTTMPEEEKGTWMNEFSIGLVKYCDGVDYSILKDPVDIIRFDPKRREFVSDKEYVNRMRPRLESVLAKYDQCMMNKYDAAIKKGDQAFLANNTNEALAAYQEALEIYPRETYPTKQINEISRQQGKQQKSSEQAEKKELENKEDSYNLALAKASVAYTRKDFSTARQNYQEALAIKPEESIPKARLQEIETILAKKTAEDAKIREVENTYKQALLKADSLMKARNYQSAREQYARASVIKPGESYPKAKSQEIDKIEEANVRAAENARKAASEKEYQAILTQADNQYKAKSYDEAKAGYSKALAMRPADPYAAQRVKLVENTMVAEKQKAQEDQALKQYREIIATADQFLEAKDLGKAREAYSRAIAVKPEDQYAQSKISTIDNMIAAEQTAKINAIEDTYKSAIGAANTAITQKSYAQAKEFLQKALAIKPGDAYASNKMTELDKTIEEQRKLREQEELKQKQYKESIAAADKLYGSGDLPAARNAFNTVLQIKPGDSYAVQKISAIDNLIAAKINSKLRQTDSVYSTNMAKGSELLAKKDYAKAREAFQQALTLKPGDPSATSKLRDIDLLIAREQERIAEEKAKKKNYDDVIASSDQKMTQKQYSDARGGYEDALAILPGATYPRQKLDEIASILKEEERILSVKQANENAYALAITNGDKYYSVKDYSRAKDEFTRATAIKPAEELPKTRLAEIENQIKAQELEQAKAKAKADAYALAINSGNSLFAVKNYAAAKNSYVEALKIMPNDKLAREQITRIDKFLSPSTRTVASTASAGADQNKAKAATSLGEFSFKTESERQKFLDELKKKYPAGITLEKYNEQYKETLRYIVIRDNQAMDYRQIRFRTYNGFQYSVNGKPITQQYFLSQVKSRQGESFQEIEMQ
jgi:tetratricopeptide (TPR) repeat protein